MTESDKVNILLVDDQPGKLLSYEAILGPLGEHLITAHSGREALEHLLRTEVAVILLDVNMPELDGFELAAMIREHPRYRKIAMIFISAIHLSDIDRLRGYEMGAVDYVPVPVVPEVLRAKVKIFAELYRKTRQLEQLNSELEQRVRERTAELEAQTQRLLESEQRRSLALAAAQMGSWHWDSVSDAYHWDDGLYRIFGVDAAAFKPSAVNIRPLLHAEDWPKFDEVMRKLLAGIGETHHVEFRIHRRGGEIRWCIGSAASTLHEATGAIQISGVILDISERKADEDRQVLLAREVDHRAKNALALVQALVRLTRAQTMEEFVHAVEGRILSLSRVHSILSQSRWEGADLASLVRDELAPFDLGNRARIAAEGPDVLLDSATAQTLALALHELTTNTAKYGALSLPSGRLDVSWRIDGCDLIIHWKEQGGPAVSQPTRQGFGTSAIVAGIKNQQGGEVTFDWKEEGLDCRLRVPLKQFAGKEPRRPKPVTEVSAVRQLNGAAPAVMIVEDEVLVALDLQESIRSLGYEVVGPYARLAEAIEGAETQTIDFAILDLNLNGEMTYELAESLQQRGIPIVFTTGYETDDVKSRLRNSRVLNKPVVRDALENLLKEHFDPPLQRAVAGR